MGIAQGYGRAAGSNGLVFAYDTGDTRNSYIGEPTTNLINPASLNIYSWWTRAVQTLETLPNETYYGMPIYRLSLSLDTDEQRNYARDPWGAGTAWYAQYLTYQANTAYIASAIYRPVSHSDMTVKGHPSNIGGWGLTYNDSVELRNGWKRHRIDRNYGAVASDHKFYHLWAPNANTGDVLVIDITCNQIEQKNHLTPFVNGTRSSTQGLLDIARSSSINITNTSFTTTADLQFDGTDDYLIVQPSQTFTLNNYAMEVVVSASALPGKRHYLIDPRGDGTENNSPMYFLFDDNGSQINIIGGNSNIEVSSGYRSIQTNTFYHIVCTRIGSTCKIYLNGTEVGSGDTGTDPLTISNKFRIATYAAGSSGQYFLNGKLAVVKIYSVGLTADQVNQNYNNYKTRFNI